MPAYDSWESHYTLFPVKLDDTGKWTWFKTVDRLACWSTYGGDLVEWYLYRNENNFSYLGQYPKFRKPFDMVDMFMRVVVATFIGWVVYCTWMVW